SNGAQAGDYILSEYAKIQKKRQFVSSDYYENERLNIQIERLLDTCVLRLERFALSKLPRGKSNKLVMLAALTSVAKKSLIMIVLGDFSLIFLNSPAMDVTTKIRKCSIC
ncbi:hypothetical protein, partial [Pseudomonas sp. SST3]|uniref:hypothetical protein n=1 Tax=Pseudomonas sp. SST3 TaxID=2267882 RepID=UPI00144408F1